MRDDVLNDLHRRFWPNKIVAVRPTGHESEILAPLFAGKSPPAEPDTPTLYVCEHFACREPVQGQAAIAAEFERWAQ